MSLRQTESGSMGDIQMNTTLKGILFSSRKLPEKKKNKPTNIDHDYTKILKRGRAKFTFSSSSYKMQPPK